MLFLIYGADGWIGKKVCLLLEEQTIPYITSKVRIDNTEQISKELDSVSPTHVICTVGRTHGTAEDGTYIPTIDYLETPGKLTENIRDNLFSPLSLALLCKEKRIHLTYLGTGCIFTYKDDKRVFTEEDEPNFFGSSYSIVKGFTDRLMHILNDSVLNIRIRMPISSDKSPRNFITKLLKYKKLCSIQNSMTVLDELLPIMVDMTKRGIKGTINLANPGTIEHKEIMDLYKEIVDPNCSYNLFSYEEQRSVLLAERSNNELSTKKLEEMYKVLPIKEAIKNTLIKYSS